MDSALLKVLACPKCRGCLSLEKGSLVCMKCKLVYPVRDGIPVMLVDEAEKIK